MYTSEASMVCARLPIVKVLFGSMFRKMDALMAPESGKSQAPTFTIFWPLLVASLQKHANSKEFAPLMHDERKLQDSRGIKAGRAGRCRATGRFENQPTLRALEVLIFPFFFLALCISLIRSALEEGVQPQFRFTRMVKNQFPAPLHPCCRWV